MLCLWGIWQDGVQGKRRLLLPLFFILGLKQFNKVIRLVETCDRVWTALGLYRKWGHLLWWSKISLRIYTWMYLCTDLRYHSTDVLGVDEFSSRNKQTLTLHLLKVLLILHLQGGGDISVCVLLYMRHMSSWVWLDTWSNNRLANILERPRGKTELIHRWQNCHTQSVRGNQRGPKIKGVWQHQITWFTGSVERVTVQEGVRFRARMNNWTFLNN